MDLKNISDAELVARLSELTGNERAVTMRVLHFLNEMDRRKLYRELGYSSLFDYCVRKLKSSESSTHRRISAARAIVTNPELEELFLNGEVTLCSISAAAKSIEAKETPIAAICNKSRREVLALVQSKELPVKPRELVIPLKIAPLIAPLLPVAPVEERVSIKFSLTKEAYAKLELARNRVSNSIRGEITLEAVFLKLLDSYLAAPREIKPRASNTSSRDISKRVKREVFERDGGSCTFTAKDGTRCKEKRHLHFDHIVPFAAGGKSETSNLRLLCRAHNKLEAERFFGKDLIAKHIQNSSTSAGEC